MIKSEKFTISGKNYAFKPGSMTIETNITVMGEEYYAYHMKVFYYKKKDGKIMACFGYVWAYADSKMTEEEFIEFYRSHYGPSPYAQWDGVHFIGTSVYENIVKYVESLKPILDNYPAIPEGYIGWYKNTPSK